MDGDESSLEDPIGWTEVAVKEYHENPKLSLSPRLSDFVHVPYWPH